MDEWGGRGTQLQPPLLLECAAVLVHPTPSAAPERGLFTVTEASPTHPPAVLLAVAGPLARFGDTAANAGALAMLEDVDVHVGLKTLFASTCAGLFRIGEAPPLPPTRRSLHAHPTHTCFFVRCLGCLSLQLHPWFVCRHTHECVPVDVAQR